MPRRTDLHKILLIGSGPIVIGQACEFDYSGTQACKSLREEGYEVILVNSNPATIMTDPEMAHRTYVEPITPEMVARIIAVEKPDALLPTLGGQTGLNVAITLEESGVLREHGVEMIGANAEAIRRAEDRELFKTTMQEAGLDLPRSGLARTPEQARAVLEDVRLPCVIRPAYTLGGEGGGIAYNVEEFEEFCARGLALSRIHEILIEEYLGGWKEFELEVMRDCHDNVVVICSIENLDPMGVHTGDSITVAPAQTLTDKEYQRLRDWSLAVIRAIGVETGGSNIQFAVDPRTGRTVVIEMNPRVSRSSALASKATGFPIAKIAAKLAVGYTLDEVPNDITRKTPACFEPVLDYVVTKIPRFAFEKFPQADPTLTSQMKSVGEVMAIGRTFPESLQKALRSLETGVTGLGLHRHDLWRPVLLGEVPREQAPTRADIRAGLVRPTAERIFSLRYALRAGWSPAEVAELTGIDPWFLHEIGRIVAGEEELLAAGALERLTPEALRAAKRLGFSDAQIATATRATEPEVREARRRHQVQPTYKIVDTCAAEFEAATPYYYSTYERRDEAPGPGDRPRVMILGSGPNRIGQGVEFDYCCVHAALALREAGYETIMVNSNPETVSTDYDTSDILCFEPLTAEDVLHLVERLSPAGVIVQFGGQTPLKLSAELAAAGVPIVGTSVDSIDLCEDRGRFSALLEELRLTQPPAATAHDVETALQAASRLGFPVLLRPSYVLGGRAMEIVYDEGGLRSYMGRAIDASEERPVLVDKFLEDAVEVDVDAIGDGTDVVIGGVMEHIEEAGIHSGDSCCALPPYSLPARVLDEVRAQCIAIARALDVRGLLNVQFAVKEDQVFVLEVNPRASRTVPFVSKSIGVPLAKVAARVMLGATLAELGFTREIRPSHICVKSPVFPFKRFPGVDTLLGPEMRSTGEVMGIDATFGRAMAKAHAAMHLALPDSGRVILSVQDRDKRAVVFLARKLESLGFKLAATAGTQRHLLQNGIPCDPVWKIKEGRPNVLDYISNQDVALVINTPSGHGSRTDRARIRALATRHGIPCITTLSGASAAVNGIAAVRFRGLEPCPLQDLHTSRSRRSP